MASAGLNVARLEVGLRGRGSAEGAGLKYDFFIAYAGPDLVTATALYRLLDKFRVFLAPESLLPGDQWDVAVPKAQCAARITVLLISANTGAAYYQQEEIAAALDLLRREEGGRHVVPVYLSGGVAPESVPFGLRRLHGLFVDELGSLEALADQLVRTLYRWDERSMREGRRAIVAYAAVAGEEIRLALYQGDAVKVGRGPDVDIVFDQPKVSAQHAELRLSGEGLVTRDLGSKNYLYVNDIRVAAALLETGDVVKLGRAGPELRVIEAPPPLKSTETEHTENFQAVPERGYLNDTS